MPESCYYHIMVKKGDEILVVELVGPYELEWPFKAEVDRYIDSLSAWSVIACDKFLKLGPSGKWAYTHGERCLVKESGMRSLPDDYEYHLKF